MDTRILSDNELVYNISNKNTSISELSFEEFIESLTPARKVFAVSLIELYKRFQAKKNNPVIIRSSENAFDCMKDNLVDLAIEECWIVLLNQGGRIISRTRMSSGGLESTLIDVRCVLREALLKRATSIMLFHNHPSGNIRPSREDDGMTDKVKEAAKTIDVRLLDHIIVGGNGNYYSYADEGKL